MSPNVTEPSESYRPMYAGHVDSSGVSWGAVIGGAFVIAALWLILLALGAGFELSTVSPWSSMRGAASHGGIGATIWLVVTQLIAASAGGYLTGRLRTRWQRIHGDEVHFRDTANGFLAWAVATVATATLLTSAAALMTGAPDAGADAAAAATSAAGPAMADATYFVDRLFLTTRPAKSETEPLAYSGAVRVFADALESPDQAGADTRYLAQVVSTETGISQADAQQRVSTAMAEAINREDARRKAAAKLLLVIFVALLIGAFCASFAATMGGRQRDGVKVI